MGNGITRSGILAAAAGDRFGVKSVDRAMEVLSFLGGHDREVSLLEISRGVGITASSVHRILSTLSGHGLVERNEGSRRYALGVRVLSLASAYRRRVTVSAAALPYMRHLRDASGETVNLHVLRRETFVCIEQVEGTHQVRRVVEVGTVQELEFRGGTGKVLFSWLPPDTRQRLLLQWRRDPRKASQLWLDRDIPALAEEIVGRGFAISSEEGVPGAAAVSAPILDQSGGIVAAISVSGPSGRLTNERMLDLGPQVARAAGEVSRALGHGA